MLLTGRASHMLITVCFVERGHRIRIISARKATKREQDDYRNQASQWRTVHSGPSDRRDEHNMTAADWADLRAMTQAEVLAAARSDPDALPVEDRTPWSLGPARRVSFAKRIRWQLGLSQAAFAKTFRIPAGTLRDWEQHRREPDQAAQAYLEVIAGIRRPSSQHCSVPSSQPMMSHAQFWACRHDASAPLPRADDMRSTRPVI